MGYSWIVMAVFIALWVSFYRFMRKRNNFRRITFWSCAAVLAIMLYTDSYGVDDNQPAQEASVASLVAALRETEDELKQYSEINAVQYLRGDEGLIVRLLVDDLADEQFLRNHTLNIFKNVYLQKGGG